MHGRKRRVDFAPGLADVQYLIEAVVKGRSNPESYFNLFRNSELIGKGSHTWLRNTVVVTIDDHDKVRDNGHKRRFCSDDGPALALAGLALNATTLGIPCIYYGSEQRFDGSGGDAFADRYIREAMFGGEFRPFRSRQRHCFDETSAVYQELIRILALRAAEPALRRGRQFLRQISGDGLNFGFPVAFGSNRILSVVAWSRILFDRELLCAINTDPHESQTSWVTIDGKLHSAGHQLTCLYPQPGPQPNLGAGMKLTIRLIVGSYSSSRRGTRVG